MGVLIKPIEKYYEELEDEVRGALDDCINKLVKIKESGGNIVVATGSGPNIHEGVTTLIAELIKKGVIDGVITSSAVIAHELAGTLDRVKRVDGKKLGLSTDFLPRGDVFEFTQMTAEEIEKLEREMVIDKELIKKGENLEGDIIIKAAGNVAYPMGLRTERISREILSVSLAYGLPFELVAGFGCDQRTMLGIGAEKNIPVMVSVPQLIGGGTVGLSIGDSIPISERCMRIALLLEKADAVIESAVALTQEIHDGPFECYTGHGIWPNWDGYRTYSLKEKVLVRIDLDVNLKDAWIKERESGMVQKSINMGKPKTKVLGVPFRMEMSGFARLEQSVPIVGDIGVIWPIMAWKICEALNISLDFISYPQESEEGKKMREWIVENVKPFDKETFLEKTKNGLPIIREGRK